MQQCYCSLLHVKLINVQSPGPAQLSACSAVVNELPKYALTIQNTGNTIILTLSTAVAFFLMFRVVLGSLHLRSLHLSKSGIYEIVEGHTLLSGKKVLKVFLVELPNFEMMLP